MRMLEDIGEDMSWCVQVCICGLRLRRSVPAWAFMSFMKWLWDLCVTPIWNLCVTSNELDKWMTCAKVDGGQLEICRCHSVSFRVACRHLCKSRYDDCDANDDDETWRWRRHIRSLFSQTAFVHIAGFLLVLTCLWCCCCCFFAAHTRLRTMWGLPWGQARLLGDGGDPSDKPQHLSIKQVPQLVSLQRW